MSGQMIGLLRLRTCSVSQYFEYIFPHYILKKICNQSERYTLRILTQEGQELEITNNNKNKNIRNLKKNGFP